MNSRSISIIQEVVKPELMSAHHSQLCSWSNLACDVPPHCASPHSSHVVLQLLLTGWHPATSCCYSCEMPLLVEQAAFLTSFPLQVFLSPMGNSNLLLPTHTLLVPWSLAVYSPFAGNPPFTGISKSSKRANQQDFSKS